MANPNIFAQFAQPVRSVVDYENDYAKADALKNQNALQSLAIQGEQQSRQAAVARANAIQKIAAQSQGDPAAYAAGLRQAGFMADADAADTSRAKISETNSVAGKNNAEAAQKNFDLHQSMVTHGLQSVIAATTPQQAAQAAADGVTQGYWSMTDAQKKIAAIPQDPAQYAQWRLQQLGALVSAKDQLEAIKPTLGTANTGGATVFTSRDPMTGAVTQNSSVANTQSPDSFATTGLGYAKLNEEKRHNGVSEGIETGKAATAAAATPKLNEGQGKATTFAARMADAESTIQALEGKGVSGTDMRTLAAGSNYTNWLASPEGQDYRQAQENWVTANLRQESGAAIGKDEMDKDVRKFFPAPGDADSVKAQKARARAVAKEGMLVQAGPGAAQVPGILSRSGSSVGSSAAAPATAGVPADIQAILAKHGGK